MKITMRETCIVRPAEDTPNQRLWLSNLDHLFVTSGHVPMIYPYNYHKSSHSSFFDARMMKDSLSKALVPFFPAAGRLAQDDESGRFEINCGGQGVLFVEAETDVSMSQLGNFSSPQLLMNFVPEVDSSKGVSSFPLLLIQVTRFRCGGVCLGIGLQHTLCDGGGLSNFMAAWSNLARGLRIDVANLPFLDRTIFRSTSPPTPVFEHTEYESITEQNATSATSTTPPQSTSTEIQNIPIHQIKHFKDKIKKKAMNYSTYEVVAAHVWRCVTIARRFPDQNQPTTLHVSVDGRNRFDPPLPHGYFGNCVFHAMVVASPAELSSESLEQTMERIRRAVRRVDGKYMKSAIDYLERPGDGATRIRVPGNSGSPHLKVISWTRLPFHQDFGWGKPICTRSANPREGKCHILPRAEDEDENVALAISLETATMKRFKGLLTSTINATLPQRYSSL